MAVIMGAIAIMFVIAITLFLRNTIVPKFLKLSGYIMALVGAFLPIYTFTIMGQSFDIGAIALIKGLSIDTYALSTINIKSGPFYTIVFILPVICIAVTLIRDDKLFNAITAFLSIIGLGISCLMVFKQLDMGSIMKLGINIGIVFMLISYGLSLAISIIKIYSFINTDNKKPIEPVDISNENLEDYIRSSQSIICSVCGEENDLDVNYCSKCGTQLKEHN